MELRRGLPTHSFHAPVSTLSDIQKPRHKATSNSRVSGAATKALCISAQCTVYVHLYTYSLLVFFALINSCVATPQKHPFLG